MSALNENVKQKILGLKLTPELLLDCYTAIAEDAVIREVPAGTLIIPLYEDGDLESGDYAPELHFVVRVVEGINNEPG